MVGGWVRVQGGVDKEFGVQILCKLYVVICFPLLEAATHSASLFDFLCVYLHS